MSDDGYTRITLRIPNELHARLSDRAARTSKSMNAEIIDRIESSFKGDKKDAFGVLKLAMDRIDRTTDSIARIKDDVESYESGHPESLQWLGGPLPHESPERVLADARDVVNLLGIEVDKLQSFIPILLDAYKGNRGVPIEVFDYLSES